MFRSNRGSFRSTAIAGNSDPDFALAGGRFIWLIRTRVEVNSRAGPPWHSLLRVIRTPLAWLTAGRNLTEIVAREVV